MKNERILIVEDENDVNRLLATILSDYQTTSAFSGTEAKLYLASAKYDLVLLDLMLPSISGIKKATISFTGFPFVISFVILYPPFLLLAPASARNDLRS